MSARLEPPPPPHTPLLRSAVPSIWSPGAPWRCTAFHPQMAWCHVAGGLLTWSSRCKRAGRNGGRGVVGTYLCPKSPPPAPPMCPAVMGVSRNLWGIRRHRGLQLTDCLCWYTRPQSPRELPHPLTPHLRSSSWLRQSQSPAQTGRRPRLVTITLPNNWARFDSEETGSRALPGWMW